MGDMSTPLLVATINGHFDLAKILLDQGANPNAAQHNGVTALYAALNCQWAPKALYPQPRAFEQQHVSYLDLMAALLEKGADPNARLTKKVWYCAVQFRSVRCGRNRGDAVLARCLHRRHGRDEAAHRARRRPEHPHDERRRPSADGRHRRARRSRTFPVCRGFRSAGRASRRCWRLPARDTGKVSRRTIIASRPAGCWRPSSTWSKS